MGLESFFSGFPRIFAGKPGSVWQPALTSKIASSCILTPRNSHDRIVKSAVPPLSPTSLNFGFFEGHRHESKNVSLRRNNLSYCFHIAYSRRRTDLRRSPYATQRHRPHRPESAGDHPHPDEREFNVVRQTVLVFGGWPDVCAAALRAERDDWCNDAQCGVRRHAERQRLCLRRRWAAVDAFVVGELSESGVGYWTRALPG